MCVCVCMYVCVCVCVCVCVSVYVIAGFQSLKMFFVVGLKLEMKALTFSFHRQASHLAEVQIGSHLLFSCAFVDFEKLPTTWSTKEFRGTGVFLWLLT